MPRPALKKRKDGRYVCYRDDIPFYGHTSLEAYAARDAYDAEKARGLRREAAGMTVAAYAAKWLPIHRARACGKSYDIYARALERFIKLVGTDALMREVTQSDIINFYNSLASFSRSYIEKNVATVRGMFASAVADHVVLSSPCEDARAPKGKAGTHRALEDWERVLVHRMADGHRFGVAGMLMLYGGLRRGEALAFNIDRDVDFAAGRIYVREALSYTEDLRGIVGDTKTSAGVRDLPLFAPLRTCLEGRHGLAVAPVRADRMTQSAFRTVWRSYLYEMSVLHNGGRSKRWVGKTREDKALIAQGGTPEVWQPVTLRPHDFRHSFCTMICDADVDIKTAMKWMGHSDAKMIRAIYDHLTALREKKAEARTAAAVDEMLANFEVDGQPDGQSEMRTQQAQ